MKSVATRIRSNRSICKCDKTVAISQEIRYLVWDKMAPIISFKSLIYEAMGAELNK